MIVETDRFKLFPHMNRRNKLVVQIESSHVHSSHGTQNVDTDFDSDDEEAPQSEGRHGTRHSPLPVTMRADPTRADVSCRIVRRVLCVAVRDYFWNEVNIDK